MTEFWYVYREYGDAPRRQHPTFVIAENEARRLAKDNGGTYYILKAEAIVTVTPNTDYLLPAFESPYSESMRTAIAKEQDPDDSIPF